MADKKTEPPVMGRTRQAHVQREREQAAERRRQAEAATETRPISASQTYHRLPRGNWRIYVPHKPGDGAFDGWKLHISVCSAEAQQELVELAATFGIQQFKLWKPPMSRQRIGQVLPEDDEKNYGKTFVVFHTRRNGRGQVIDWKNFIEKADRITREHGDIGLPVRGDKKILGSRAVYYRCDADEHHEYAARAGISVAVRDHHLHVARRYCPCDEYVDTDPFSHIVLADAALLSPDQQAMLHAVYMGDVETVGTLRNRNPRLAHFREPATGETVREIALKLASIEQGLQQHGHPVLQEVLDMPKMVESSTARRRPSEDETTVMIRPGRTTGRQL